MEPDDGLLLAGLLCARLCHDLSGPVGAVATGAELLAEEGTPAEIGPEALALLTTSAAAAGARLRFLRIAFGAAGGPATAAQLHDITRDFLASLTGREALALDWRAAPERALAGPAARLLLNLVLLGRDCLPRGGRLAVSLDPLATLAEGPGARPGEAVAALAATTLAELTARGAQGYLAARLSVAEGLSLHVEPADGRVRIAAVPA